ncbi:D-alanyl-D-alanine carboxypeptidase family protein [Candidatus Saccharibacteria bacterium]|nr:D-alanyl-D-alanine carboxypeptidase family protein [Candidatus Saccharibacteria bacterium]
MKKELRIRFSRKTIILAVSGFFLISFLTWFLISFLTAELKLEVVNLYEFPEVATLSDSFAEDGGIFSVAIDGNVVAGNEKEVTRPTASTAKMILGLSIMRAKPFELGESGEMITITEEFYDRYIYYLYNDGSNTTVSVGEEISEYDALMSVFLASSNNMADTLAIWAFGSLEAYREYATNLLAELGIHNTTVGEDASGFSDTTTSTADDLAKIGNLVLENPVLAEIVKTASADVPVAGALYNTNRLLGVERIVGVKTGFIGEASGYCLVSGYKQEEHNVTIAVLGESTREGSFDKSLSLVQKMQELVKPQTLVHEGQTVGYYESWWTGRVPIYAEMDLNEIIYAEVEKSSEIIMDKETGEFEILIGEKSFKVPVKAKEYAESPSFWEKVKHVFGWEKKREEITGEVNEPVVEPEVAPEPETAPESAEEVFTYAPAGNNCTIPFGRLMLVNPNFVVDNNFIATRRGELVSISSLYGIKEHNVYNGDNLLDAEAAVHLNNLVKAYEAEYPGHTLGTLSCFRAVGTTCGRMCAATGTSDHHTGLTCDLIDATYGTELGTEYNHLHPEWTWLHNNSYKYGFIDRFPPEWAGGPMSAPANVDANGTTGLYETWHFRYVGIPEATEIATGVYNNGQYDSLEHYLKARGMVTDLKNARCK